jgi:hypothetical protein
MPPVHRHLPDVHVSPGVHAMPQPPQLSGSESRLVHPCAHADRPGAHEGAHMPLTHGEPNGQMRPHEPQSLGLLARSSHCVPQRNGSWPTVQRQLPKEHD